jgi:hypothetical protein
MHPSGDASPIVNDGHAAVDMDHDLDRLTESGHVLVNTVIDDFINEMMKTIDAGAADIHRGPLPHRIEPFKDFDLIRAVAIRLGRSD